MAKEDEIYRAFCRELVGLGVDQKKIGEKAGYKSPNSWASKFLSGQIESLKITGSKNLDHYFEELVDVLNRRPKAASTHRTKDPKLRDRKAG